MIAADAAPSSSLLLLGIWCCWHVKELIVAALVEVHPWHCIVGSCNLLRSDDAAVLPGVCLESLFQLLDPGLEDLLLLANPLQRCDQSLLVVIPAIVQLVLSS